jgi:hypothetical protein
VLAGSGPLQFAPKQRLPILPLARVPIQNHFRAKDDVLVENVSDSSGQLIGAQFSALAAHVICHRRELRTGRKAGQILHDPPRHHVLIEKIRRFGLRESVLEKIAKEILWKRELHIGANALAFCDLLLEPAPHAVALHNDNFRQEGRPQRIGH